MVRKTVGDDPEPPQRRPGEGTHPQPPRPKPPVDVTHPDLVIQIRDPVETHPPCLADDVRAQIEGAIRDAVGAKLPGAYFDSVCAGSGDPKNQAAAFGVWAQPDVTVTDDLKQARKVALGESIGRTAGETIAFFISAGLFARLGQGAWKDMPKRLDGDGNADSGGPIHLTNLRVEMRPPATIATIITGFDERPLPDASFTLTIAETFADGGAKHTSVQSLDVDSTWNDVLAITAGLGGLVSRWFLPALALGIFQSVKIRQAGAREKPGVGSTVAERFMPLAIPVPGGNEIPISYSQRVEVQLRGMFAGGFLLNPVPQDATTVTVSTPAVRGPGNQSGNPRQEPRIPGPKSGNPRQEP